MGWLDPRRCAAFALALALGGCGAGLGLRDGRGSSHRPSGARETLTTELSVDRLGGDYGALRARDLTTCRAACARDARCRAFSFYVEEGPGGLTCFLKSRVPGAVPREGVISGQRTASAEAEVPRS